MENKSEFIEISALKEIIDKLISENQSGFIEISSLKERIDQLIRENINTSKHIPDNTEFIQKITEKNSLLEKQKKESDFDYNPLIDGQINGIPIHSICVHECFCMRFNKVPCSGKHCIAIYSTEYGNRLNFNDEKSFSLEELEKLNYIQKLKITIDEDHESELMRKCSLAKLYPDKVYAYYSNYGAD
jgi:hypothetical protein